MSSQHVATPHLLPWMQNTMGLENDEGGDELELELELELSIYNTMELENDEGRDEFEELEIELESEKSLSSNFKLMEIDEGGDELEELELELSIYNTMGLDNDEGVKDELELELELESEWNQNGIRMEHDGAGE